MRKFNVTRFNKVIFWKNPTLYALKTLIFNLTMPSSALDTFCEPAIYGWQPVRPVPCLHGNMWDLSWNLERHLLLPKPHFVTCNWWSAACRTCPKHARKHVRPVLEFRTPPAATTDTFTIRSPHQACDGQIKNTRQLDSQIISVE